MQEKGVEPSDIRSVDDLHLLPFLTKDDLTEANPFGLLGAPLEECVRIHSTGGSHKVGCLLLPMSSGNTDRQLQFMCDLGATILCCTPSYDACYLGETIAEKGLKGKMKLKAMLGIYERYVLLYPSRLNEVNARLYVFIIGRLNLY